MPSKSRSASALRQPASLFTKSSHSLSPMNTKGGRSVEKDASALVTVVVVGGEEMVCMGGPKHTPTLGAVQGTCAMSARARFLPCSTCGTSQTFT